LLSEDSDDEEQQDDSEDIEMEIETPEQQRQARQAALEALVPGIEPAEYGQISPSFHRNSQRVTREADSEEVHDAFSEKHPPIRAPILTRDQYEGVDSDDESDEEESEEEGGSEDDRPQLVDDIEIDMSEEQDEFLEFARQTLGMSDQQWHDIVTERKERGGTFMVQLCSTVHFDAFFQHSFQKTL
jgi:hypothetical protein